MCGVTFSDMFSDTCLRPEHIERPNISCWRFPSITSLPADRCINGQPEHCNSVFTAKPFTIMGASARLHAELNCLTVRTCKKPEFALLRHGSFCDACAVPATARTIFTRQVTSFAGCWNTSRSERATWLKTLDLNRLGTFYRNLVRMRNGLPARPRLQAQFRHDPESARNILSARCYDRS